MSKNQFKGHDEEAIQKDREKKEEEFGGDEEVDPRIRVQDRLNVFWVLPRMGNMPKFYKRALIHWRPFHHCGRAAKIEKAENPNEFIEDRNFSNCYRCINAWNTWDDNYGDSDAYPEEYSKFKDDMPNDSLIFQAVDLSPFFKLHRNGISLEPNEANIKFMDEFLNILSGDLSEDEAEEAGVPEEVIQAALPGVDRVIVSEFSVGKHVIHKEMETRVERNLDDTPLMMPEEYLLKIDREVTNDTFAGSGGQQVRKRNYKISFKSVDWDFPEDLWQIAGEQAQDLTVIDPEEDTLEARAFALEKLPEDDMKEYLEEFGHSFDVHEEGSEEDFVDEDLSDFESADKDVSDPDSFSEEDSLLASDNENLAEAKKELREEA